MARPSCLLFLLVCIMGCRGSQQGPFRILPPLQEQLAKGAPVLMAMTRTACEGTCPVYRLILRTDGTLEYFGAEHVEVLGERTARLSKAQLAQVRMALSRAGLESLDPANPQYTCPHGMIDRAGVSLVVPGAGLNAPICYASPIHERETPDLDGLDIRVDLIVDSPRWVGTAPIGATRLELR